MNAIARASQASEPLLPARALTAQGELHEVPLEVREMLCFLETGDLLVVHGSQMDQYVLAFRDDIRRKGLKPSVRPCSLSELRDSYARSPPPIGGAKAEVTSRKDSENQGKVYEIFEGAVKERASDIHIHDDGKVCRIRIRVNGLMEDYAPLSEVRTEIGLELRATIYQGLCDIADTTFKPHMRQDARLKESFVQALGLYGARVATCPQDKGQMMVIRLLYSKAGENWNLERLGYLPEQAAPISAMTENKHGIHIFAGATGSGKSTSLEVLITRLIRNFNFQLHVLTLENPPEYKIQGARQTPIVNDDFVGAIKNAMRLDPDVIMIGEMRDFVSAQAAFQAALTGHGVWTTLHANDPFAILQRLDELKLDPGLYSDASLVRGLIYQCLVPIICNQCRIPMSKIAHSLSAEKKARISEYCGNEGIYFQNEEGCPECRKGFKGRSVVAEVVSPTQDLMDMFRTQGKAVARRSWIVDHQGITRATHLALLIRQGLVDPVIGEAMVSRLDADKIILRKHP